MAGPRGPRWGSGGRLVRARGSWSSPECGERSTSAAMRSAGSCRLLGGRLPARARPCPHHTSDCRARVEILPSPVRHPAPQATSRARVEAFTRARRARGCGPVPLPGGAERADESARYPRLPRHPRPRPLGHDERRLPREHLWMRPELPPRLVRAIADGGLDRLARRYMDAERSGRRARAASGRDHRRGPQRAPPPPQVTGTDARQLPGRGASDHADFTQELPRKLLPTRAKEAQRRRGKKR